VNGEPGLPPRQRPSIAAPSWHAPRVLPFIVSFKERRTRLKGAVWLRNCPVVREVPRPRVRREMSVVDRILVLKVGSTRVIFVRVY
jgi:hypothetical protein